MKINNCYTQVFYLDFSSGLNKFNMHSLNNNYIDDFAKPNKIFSKNIITGGSCNSSFNIIVTKSLSIGISYTNLFSHLNDKTEYRILDSLGNTNLYYGKSHIEINSNNIGIVSSLSIKELLGNSINFKLINKLDLFLALDVGYGFSKIRFDFYAPEYPSYNLLPQITSYKYKGNGISVLTYVKLNYLLSNKLNIGLTSGYRFYEVKTLEDLYGNIYMLNNSKIELDFSGFSLTAFLRIYI